MGLISDFIRYRRLRRETERQFHDLEEVVRKMEEPEFRVDTVPYVVCLLRPEGDHTFMAAVRTLYAAAGAVDFIANAYLSSLFLMVGPAVADARSTDAAGMLADEILRKLPDDVKCLFGVAAMTASFFPAKSEKSSYYGGWRFPTPIGSCGNCRCSSSGLPGGSISLDPDRRQPLPSSR